MKKEKKKLIIFVHAHVSTMDVIPKESCRYPFFFT